MLSIDLTVLHDTMTSHIMFTLIRKRQVYHKLIALVTASFFFLSIFTADVLALAPESRLKPFFEKHDVNFQDIATVMLAAGQLRSMLATGDARQGNIVRLNRLFPSGEVEIKNDIEQGTLRCSGREYNYAVFRFKKENKTIEARFFKDYDKLTDEELLELGVKSDEDRRHFNSPENPALKGVWFVNPKSAGPASVVGSNKPDAAESSEPKYSTEKGAGRSSSSREFIEDELGSRMIIERDGISWLNARLFEEVTGTLLVGSARYLGTEDGLAPFDVLGDLDVGYIDKTQDDAARMDRLVNDLERWGVRNGKRKTMKGKVWQQLIFSCGKKLVDIGYRTSSAHSCETTKSWIDRFSENLANEEDPSVTQKIKRYLQVEYYYGAKERYGNNLRRYIACRNNPAEFEKLYLLLKDNEIGLLIKEAGRLTDDDRSKRIMDRLMQHGNRGRSSRLNSEKKPDLSDLSDAAINTLVATQTEARRVHDENMKIEYMPTIPDKTILCHIVTNSILPVQQRDMLKTLEQEMRSEKYGEKVVSLSIAASASPEEFMAKLEMVKAQIELQYQDYAVQFDVACPSKDLVSKIQRLGMQALAFTKEGDGDIIQVEGIILALRALQTGSINNLLDVYKLLTGREQTVGTNDINELAKMMLFILPVRKVDVNALGTLNRIMEENIKTAA